MRTAVSIIIQRGNRYLSVSRRDDPTKWGLVGGKVDDGESSAQAMKRELFEEVSIDEDMKNMQPIYSGVCYGDVTYWVTTYLLTSGKQFSIVPEDGLTYAWMTEDELCHPGISPFASYNRLAFEAMHTFLYSDV